MKIITTFAILLGFSVYNISFAEDWHDHKGHNHKEEKTQQSKDKYKHNDEDGHDHNKKKKKKKKKKKHDDHKGHDHLDEHKHNEGEKHDDHSSHKGEDDHSGHDDHGGPKFGKGRAIVEIKNEGKLFKLATGAIKTLSLQTVKLDTPNKGFYEIPSSAVVDFQDEIGIYRQKGDWFELVEVKVVQRGKYSAKVNSPKLAKNDQIVSQGVPLLRVAHLEASGQGGQGHAH